VHELNPEYNLPGRTKISEVIESMSAACRTATHKDFENVRVIEQYDVYDGTVITADSMAEVALIVDQATTKRCLIGWFFDGLFSLSNQWHHRDCFNLLGGRLLSLWFLS
jgi:hypothetical protein